MLINSVISGKKSSEYNDTGKHDVTSEHYLFYGWTTRLRTWHEGKKDVG